MMRTLMVMLAALSLTACNAAVSEKPLFLAREARGAPALKPGLWAMMEDADCALDVAHPPTQWPECAKPLIFDGHALSSPSDGKKPFPYLLAKGSPRILQILMEDGGEPIDPNGGAYIYLAVAPEPGKPVTVASAWLVQCGPPPEGQSNALTEHPLPSMTIRDKTCYAASAQAIRDAAGPSRDWGDEPMRLVWVARLPR